MPYCYSMLRFVPDPARGEYINIGAIAGDDETGDWELRQVQNLKRAKSVDDCDRLWIALSFIASIEEHIQALDQLPDLGREPMSTKLLERWADEMQNVVQLSRPAPLVADTAEAALDVVFSQLIVDPATPRFRFEKHRAIRLTRQAYRSHGVSDDAIAMRANVTAGSYGHAFDFAVYNSRRVFQLVQCWSFQLPNQAELAEQVKAWAWTVYALRQHGGTLTLAKRSLEVPPGEQLDIASVYIPPKPEQEAPAFHEASAAFKEVQVSAVAIDRADQIGGRAANLLEQAGGRP
jgi:hypothetical protein